MGLGAPEQMSATSTYRSEVYRSDRLVIVSARSNVIRSLVAELDHDIAYCLSAGNGEFRLPPWPDEPEPATCSDMAMAASILNWRENQQAALAAAVESWLAAGAKRLVLEAIGSPGSDHIAFLQGCRRLLPEASPPVLVLLHEPSGLLHPPEPDAAEILLALSLSGGSMNAEQFGALAGTRGWDPSAVAALTSTRRAVRTYAGADEWRWARTAEKAADARLVQELAGAVAANCPRLPAATLALTADPIQALPLFRVRSAGPAIVAAYGRRLWRAGAPKQMAGTMRLAAWVAGRSRVSPEGAQSLLRAAERVGIGEPVRSLFAFALGQVLAKDPEPGRKTASLRCFDYVRACEAETPEARASHAATAYNGAGLALMGAGDVEAAVAAERSGLAALEDPGTVERGGLHEQKILILTNLAKLYRRLGETQPALACCRHAWLIAQSRGSLSGLAYAAADLVRGLIDAGDRAEAEVVTMTLLRRFEAARLYRPASERSAVGCCLALADLSLSAGEVAAAAGWYAKAVRRMHRGNPAFVGAIIENLSRMSPSDPAVEFLRAEQAAHEAVANDLRALLSLASGGE
jgi:hypothetical protein